MHVLMLGFFTQMCPATAPLALNLLVNIMRMPSSMNMVTELAGDIEHGVFIPLVFLQLGACMRYVRPLFSTDAWLICLPFIGDRITARLLASWLRCCLPLRYFDVPSCVSVQWKQVFCMSSCAWATIDLSCQWSLLRAG